ncbi:MAG: heavy metal translocating P-type ATPase [Acidimicrobiales bacterium]|nr:heavy metal translocating P-type ATPase [Acidimicrobiales bacterium]
MSADRHLDRPVPPAGPAVVSCGDGDDCCATPLVATSLSGPTSGAGVVTFRVEELDCATEEQQLRTALAPLDGVRALEFDLVGRQVRVRHDLASPAPIESAIRELGMRPTIVAGGEDEPLRRGLSGRAVGVMAAAGVLAVGAEVAVIAGVDEQSVPIAMLALAAIALGGRDTLRKAVQALRSRRMTMSLLMSVAVIGAIAIGQWPEAAVVIWLFAVAELIEALSLERARNAIRSLVALAPETATVRRDGAWIAVATGTVALGDVLLVKPGERIALDGQVASGSSTVNQAPITGESVPVAKEVGDVVFAGTINERGTLEVRVTAAKGEGTLDRIARSIQEAQADKAPAQRFVDRFAAVYTPAVFVLAVVIAVVPVVTGHGSFRDWFYRALVLLVIACPCALVISTPVTVVAGLGGAARRGILIKGGVHLEQARKLRVVALDKTGTLTHGTPVLTDLINLGALTDEQILRVAASIEALSEHPVAHAIVTAHTGTLADVDGFEAITGRGVRAVVDGVTYTLGNHRLVEETGQCSPEVEETLERLEREAKTAIVLMNTEPLAILAVADTLRPTARQAVADLAAIGVATIMLTGDNQRTATAIATEAGIVDARGDLLPDDKLRIITELVAAGGGVGMVGDGVNDAPALARADLGIAMGAAGTDTAIETADIALMDDDPRKIAETIRISTHTAHVLWQNITIALGVKVVFLVLTITGTASLWLAVLADMGASLVVIGNGLRLLRRPAHGTHAGSRADTAATVPGR